MQSGIWVIVLAAGDISGAGHPTTTPRVLREQLDRAAALAPRSRIYAVVRQEQRRRLEVPLWILPRSNVLVQPGEIGSAHGILYALLRIWERDPHARVVLLPATQHANDEESFLGSLRNAVADTANKPENVILLSVEPDAAEDGIVVGRARALLQLFEPERVATMREIVERVSHARADPTAITDLLDRLSLPYLDFHRHVLAGEKRHSGQRTLPLGAAEST